MKIKTIQLQVLALVILFCNAGLCNADKNEVLNAENIVKKFDDWEFGAYSKEALNKMKIIRKKLTDRDLKTVKSYLAASYLKSVRRYDVLNVIVFFAFLMDRAILPEVKEIYLRTNNPDLKAACEAYFVNVGYKNDVFFKKILETVKNANQEQYYILYAISPISSKKMAKILIEKNINYGGYGEAYGGEGAVYWTDAMSWVERDERWLQDGEGAYIYERMKKERKKRGLPVN